MISSVEPLDDEVEELRELIYEILKDFPTGITSKFLEQKYTERYVEKGLAKQLPMNWLSLMRSTEEFEVKDVSTFTMVYLMQVPRPEPVSLPSEYTVWKRSSDTTSAHNSKSVITNMKDDTMSPADPAIVVQFNIDEFDPVPLNSLPQPSSEPMPIILICVIDPDAIYFRLPIWTPYCEYLYAALSRLPSSNNLEPNIGEVLAANINGRWERVEMIKPSSADPNFWVVMVVDEGYFHAVHRNHLRPLTGAVTAFNKIFLAKCKLGIDRPSPNEMVMEGPNRVWSAKAQHFVIESLRKTTLRNDCRTELLLEKGHSWDYTEKQKIPTCTAKLLIDGVDIATQIAMMGASE